MDTPTKNSEIEYLSEQIRHVSEQKISWTEALLKIQELNEKLAQAICRLSGEQPPKHTEKENQMPSKMMVEGIIVKTGDKVCDSSGNTYTFQRLCGRNKVHVYPHPREGQGTRHIAVTELKAFSKPIEDGQTITI